MSAVNVSTFLFLFVVSAACSFFLARAIDPLKVQFFGLILSVVAVYLVKRRRAIDVVKPQFVWIRDR